MTVYLVISLPKIPYTHRIYMVLAHPKHIVRRSAQLECNITAHKRDDEMRPEKKKRY